MLLSPVWGNKNRKAPLWRELGVSDVVAPRWQRLGCLRRVHSWTVRSQMQRVLLQLGEKPACWLVRLKAAGLRPHSALNEKRLLCNIRAIRPPQLFWVKKNNNKKTENRWSDWRSWQREEEEERGRKRKHWCLHLIIRLRRVDRWRWWARWGSFLG